MIVPWTDAWSALPVVTAIGLPLATWRTRWRRTALWTSLALLAAVAALQLITLTHYSIYQHYRPWSELANGGWLSAIVLLVQLAVIVIHSVRHRAAVLHALRSIRTSAFWILAGLALWAGMLAVPTQALSRVAGEVILAALISATALANLAFAAGAAPAEGLLALRSWFSARLTLTDDQRGGAPWDGRLPWIAALLALVGSALISVVVLEAMPHIDDSISYYFHARYLSAGHLMLPAPPDSAAFHVDEVIVDHGHWFGYGFPGWPAILAMGTLVGVPWLVNPLLGAASVLLTHRIVRRLYGLATAHATALSLALSPWLLVMSAEFMPHPAALFFGLLALLALIRARGGRPGWAAAAGIFMGMLFLTRPLDCLLLGVAYAAWLLVDRAARLKLTSVLVAGMSSIAVAALIFAYNAAVTGRATYAPHMMWTDRRWGAGVDRLGFGPDIGIPAWRNIDPLPGHGIVDVVLNANKNLFEANWVLFGWMCGSLILIIAYVITRAFSRRDTLMLLMVGAIVLGHSLYWFSGGPDLGPRYWYAAIPAFVVLSWRGALAVAARLSSARATPLAIERVVLFVVIASMCGLLTNLPWRLENRHFRYRDVGARVRELVHANDIEGALVFIRSPHREDYQSAFNLNPKTLDDKGTVFAWDVGRDHSRRVVLRFPNRPVWVIGRTDSVAPLRVLAGPLAPGSLPR